MIYNYFKNTVLFLTAIFAIHVVSFASSLYGVDLNQVINFEENSKVVYGVQEYSEVNQNQNNPSLGQSIEIFDIEEEDDEESFAKHSFSFPFTIIYNTPFIVYSNTLTNELRSSNFISHFSSYRSLNVAFCVFRL